MCIKLCACKCAPVSLARNESAPPDWRGIMKVVIEPLSLFSINSESLCVFVFGTITLFKLTSFVVGNLFIKIKSSFLEFYIRF